MPTSATSQPQHGGPWAGIPAELLAGCEKHIFVRDDGRQGPPPPSARTRRRRRRREREERRRAEDRAWPRIADICRGSELTEGEAGRLLEAVGAGKGAPNLVLRHLLWVVRATADEILATEGSRKLYLTDPSALARERDWGLFDVMRELMAMGASNLGEEIARASSGEERIPSAAGFCQRRRLVRPEAFELLFRRVAGACLGICGPGATFRGMRILAVDGTAVNVSGDPSQPMTHVDGAGGGWDQYHLNGLYDVGAGLFVGAVLQPIRETHETRACCRMIERAVILAPSLLLADRGYGSLNLIETVRRTRNLDCVVRVKENWIKEVAELPRRELDRVMTVRVITTQTKEDKERVRRGEAKYLSGRSPYGKYKSSQAWDFESEVDVTFRVIRTRLSSGKWETLVTTLLDRAAYPTADLIGCYARRWKLEVSYRSLKWQSHMAQMHCRLDESARQEVWARLAMYDVVTAVVAAAEAAHPHEDRGIWRTVPERGFAAALVREFFARPDAVACDVPLEVSRRRVPVRPGRRRPRPMRAIGFFPLHYR